MHLYWPLTNLIRLINCGKPRLTRFISILKTENIWKNNKSDRLETRLEKV
jgi:hypothetical protein